MKLFFQIPAALYAIVQVANAVPAPTAEQMQAILKARPELDEIRWKDPARGAPLKVRVMSANAQAVIVEKVLPAGLTSRTIPLGDLSGIEFAFTPREFSLHQQPEPAAIPALKILWDARQATMRLSGSNAAETGLALAKSLRFVGDVSSSQEAVKILDQIRAEDHSDFHKGQARAELATLEFVRSMASGKPEETDKLAWKITEEANHPDAMLLATAFLGDRQFAALRAIEQANPRWMEDDEIKPVRERLYHLALDFSLYPSLFLGTREAEAAAGLKKAADMYQFANENELAKGVLEDLAALYPESAPAKETAPLLAKLKQAEAAGKLSETPAAAAKSATDEKDAAIKTTPTGAPPPPKRYNIFGD